MPSWRASDGRGNPPVYRRRRPGEGNGKRGFRIPSAIRFLLFAGALSVFVLVALLTALRPIVRAGVVGWAWDNPSSIVRFPFIGDFVREELGTAIGAPAGTDPTESVFVVNPGDTIFTLAPRLLEGGYVASEHAFLYVGLETKLNDKLSAGSFLLRGNMTPAQVADALIEARVTVTTINVTFREGLRIEQMTALLETVASSVDPSAFYDLAKHPTPELLADYPWLKLPEGASLEGFLFPATYELITATNGGPYTVTDADGLVRMLLDKFYSAVGEARLNVPAERGLSFYEVLTLASLVEHEAAVDSDRALIAGVFQNRLDKLHGAAPVLGTEPSITYATDTMALAKIPIDAWVDYFFWKAVPGSPSTIKVDAKLQGYQTYQSAGLPPGPISTPSLASIDAALNPDQADGYLYFVLIPNTKTHDYARTLAEHNALLVKYGYR